MQNPEDFRANVERAFRFADKNGDGKVTKKEAEEGRGRILERLIELGDTDKDGALSMEELKKVPPPPDGQRRGSREYFMPDLNNPGSQGTRTDPPVSVPSPAVTIRAPTAAPVPDDEPPAIFPAS